MSTQPDFAGAFLEFLTSHAGSAILALHGYEPFGDPADSKSAELSVGERP
jgi:hypothetical protein